MSYYYPQGGMVSSPLGEKPAVLYSQYPQHTGIPGAVSSPSTPPNFTISTANGLRGPAPNGISPYGPGAGFRSPGLPPSAGLYSTGIAMPPSVRSPSMGPSGMPSSMGPSQGHGSGLGPAATGLSAVAQAAQAYPHLAGAAGYPSPNPMAGYGQALGASPYGSYGMPAGYPASMTSPAAQYLNSAPQQAYGGMRSPNASSYPGVPCSYVSSINSWGGGIQSQPSYSNSMYGLQGLRGQVGGSSYPTSSLQGSVMAYPGSIPGHASSNPSMLPGAPVVPTPGYPSISPYGRPL